MKVKLILLLLILVACKTQEDINRDQQVDTMAAQMAQHQKLSAQYTSKTLELEEKLTKMIGSIDEREHQNYQTTNQEINNSKRSIEELQKDLDSVKVQMLEQKEYLEKILASLSKMGEAPSKKKSQKAGYEEAIRLFTKGNVKEAKPILAGLLDDKKLDLSQRAKVNYYLGMIAYQEKKFSDAVTLFSRLYTEYPSSSHNPSGLLYLGRSFLKLKKNEEGKQVLEELVEKFPNNSNAQKAQDILKSL
jgi:TolA-binding protein